MKKTLTVILAVLMAATLLAGCSDGAHKTQATTAAETEAASASAEVTEAVTEAETIVQEETMAAIPTDYEPFELTIGSINDVGSMYPGGAMMTGRKSMHSICYETLFWNNPETGELDPLIAKSYTEKGNGTYEIELFDYVKDSAGNNLTASDVVFCVETYKADGQNSSIYETITECKAIDDYTVSVTFAPESKGQFIAFCTYIYMYTQKAYEDSGDGLISEPIATGGYTLDKENTVTGSIYVFNHVGEHWQTDEQYINDRNAYRAEKITIKVVTDASTLAMELQNGSVDFVADITAADRTNFMNDDGTAKEGYFLKQGTNNAFAHFTFNCSDVSPCGDINLRKAICYAVDAAACAYAAHGSFGEECPFSTNPNLEDVDISMANGDYYTYSADMTKAKEYLEKSNYNGETIKILVQPNALIKSAAPLIKQYLSMVGIESDTLEFTMPEYRALEADTTGTEYDIKFNGLGSVDDYINKSCQELSYASDENELNSCYIHDEKLQELYEAAASVDGTEDDVKALLDYTEEQCYMYGLYYGPKVFIARDCIKYMAYSLPEDAVLGSIIKIED